MKYLHRMVQLLLFAVVLAGGLVLAVTPLSNGLWEALLDALRHNRLAVLLDGLVLLVLAAAFVLTDLGRRNRDRMITLEGEGGKVTISSRAISDYVMRLAAEFPSVARMTPRVIPLRREIDIHVELRVKAGAQVHEICEMLQRRVREMMSSGLGISQVRRVEVAVAEVVSEHRPR